jgi:hypothetical protein
MRRAAPSALTTPIPPLKASAQASKSISIFPGLATYGQRAICRSSREPMSNFTEALLQKLKCWGLCLVGHGRRACVTGGDAGFRPVS